MTRFVVDSKTHRVAWNDQPAIDAAEEGGKDGLQLGSRIVLAMANVHVPFEQGHLIGSANVDWNGEEASVYYDTVYARRMHQNPQFHFQNGREGRWLKTAAMKSKPNLLQCFGDALKVRMRKRNTFFAPYQKKVV